MARVYVRIVLIPVLLFTAALLLIHTQSYNDHDLRQLLLPDGCPAPCFMGIRPGITSLDEAVQILKASGWVDQTTTDNTVISWTWNGKQALFIDGTQTPRMTISINTNGDEVINDMTIPTYITTGAIMLAMQRPMAFMLTSAVEPVSGTKTSFVSLRYSDFLIKGTLACPSRIHDLVHQPAMITFYNHQNANFDFEEQFWDNGRLVSFSTDQIICKL